MATTQPGGSMTSRTASETRGPPGTSHQGASSSATGAKFRHGLLQLMIHTIDPLHDGKPELPVVDGEMFFCFFLCS